MMQRLHRARGLASSIVVWALFCLQLVSVASAAAGSSSSLRSSAPSFKSPLLAPLAASQPSSDQAFLTSVLNNDETMAKCKPTGQISDARCDYETVEMDVNSANFFPILDNLRRERYFRLYKVDLYKDCPFWNDNSLCMSRDCTVSKVDDSVIPEEYQSSSLSSVTMSHNVDDEIDPHASHALSSTDTCQCAATDFCHWEDEEWSPESSWVDLLDNPERFTGYAGTSAHRVWRAIYEENCFGVARTVGSSASTSSSTGTSKQAAAFGSYGNTSAAAAAEALSSLMSGQSAPLDTSSSENEQCLEKRVFYKLISGLHASISIHICHDYLDQETGQWKPNLACFVERIAQHPDRLQNLYFAHTVLLRSLAKLAQRIGYTPASSAKPFGLKEKARMAEKLIDLAPGLPSALSTTSLHLSSLLQQAVNAPPTFDEASMFDQSDPESELLRTEFRDRFRNVSRIMDCVGCDKCRLWGKLQINGLGTALKILFESSHLSPTRLLQRSELVALINTIHRVSESIRAVETFRKQFQAEIDRQTKEAHLQQAPKRKEASSNVDEPRRRNVSAKQPLASDKDLPAKVEQKPERTFSDGLRRVLRLCEDQWARCLLWFSHVTTHARRLLDTPKAPSAPVDRRDGKQEL